MADGATRAAEEAAQWRGEFRRRGRALLVGGAGGRSVGEPALSLRRDGVRDLGDRAVVGRVIGQVVGLVDDFGFAGTAAPRPVDDRYPGAFPRAERGGVKQL